MAPKNKSFDPVKALEEIENKFEMFQILDQDGKVTNKDAMPDLSDDDLVELMKRMVWKEEATCLLMLSFPTY